MVKDKDNKKGLQLSWLKSYLAIVREKSITRAAKELGTSQPTLTKQMYELEDHLQKTLLIRSKKSVTMTEEGEYFRSKAKEILGLIEQTELALAPAGK